MSENEQRRHIGDAATLEIRDLHAEVEGKEILKGIDLSWRKGRPTP